MASNKNDYLIDSHIHLWSYKDANKKSHYWMNESSPLAKSHELPDYASDASSMYTLRTIPNGYIYIETNRTSSASGNIWDQNPKTGEIDWICELINGNKALQEEFTEKVGTGSRRPRLLGVIPWAPLKIVEGYDIETHPDLFLAYCSMLCTKIEQQTGNINNIHYVKGFRFLLQDIHDQDEFKSLVLGSAFTEALRSFCKSRDTPGHSFFTPTRTRKQGLVFDVGIDQNNGGTWQLETFEKCITSVEQLYDHNIEMGAVFVLNHGCKPSFTSAQFQEWRACMVKFAGHENVYMKLSGFFSELPELAKETSQQFDVKAFYSHHDLQPWFKTLFESFGPMKIMFGSDWPVCNVNGPGDFSTTFPAQEDVESQKIQKSTWCCWYELVEYALEINGMSDDEKEWVRWKTANKAYSLGVDD